MLKEIAAEYASKPLKEFRPFAKACDRDAWNKLDEAWALANLEHARSYLGFKYEALSASDFLEFTHTGNRVNYENKLFAKRKALSSLVIGECIEYKGNFIDDIVNGLFSICEESAWFLPAHNTYIRDAVQLPLPDACDPVLELFSCETGAILATTLYLLEPELDKISPFIAKRIRYEINHRIIKPYFNHHFWWMGKGDERMCNWTIWCTQNVLISAFLSGNANEDTLNKIIYKASESSDYFLKDYGEDGCCEEGAQYYRHSGLCLYNVIDILDQVTGVFAPLFKNNKVQNIAKYIMNMHVSGPYYFNFADCAPIAGRATAREYLFAKAIDDYEMLKYAAQDYCDDYSSSLILKDENNLYYRLQNGFAAKDIQDFYNNNLGEGAGSENISQNNNAGLMQIKELYYPSTGTFISGDGELALAVKAGGNGESHNHNDTGSFTIYSLGKPFIIDIGVESYTKKTFSDRRYEIWTMQSAYHNLPTIGGVMQKDGDEYCASNVEYSFDKDKSSISMDIHKAYPLASLESYIRKVTLTKGSDVCVEDIVTSNENSDIILSLMTYDKPSPVSDSEIAVGDVGIIKYKNCSLLNIEECPITDARLAITWKHSVYRILLKYNSNDIKLTFKKS